jgi:hypothetical protein
MKKSILVDCLRLGRKHLPKHPEWDNYKHYSYIIQNNEIIESGTNCSGPPLIGYEKWQKIHSESRAYFKARGLLDKNRHFDVVNIRFNKSGKMLLSKPCKCCISFLKFLGCHAIWFSTEAGFARLALKNN